MTVRDHVGMTLSEFNGLWSRGNPDETPIDFFSQCNNVKSVGASSFATRDGIGILQSVAAPLYNIKRIYNYPTQTANTLLVLTYDGTTGKIYHIISSTLVYGPILSIAGMQDFAFVPFAGRAFISPFATTLETLNSPAALTALVTAGTGLGVGIYNYAVTFVTAVGETAPSALSTVTTSAGIANPVVTPLLTNNGVLYPGNALTAGQTYKWLFTYTQDFITETQISSASTGFVAPVTANQVTIQSSASITPTLYVNIYRTVGNGSTYYREFTGISVANLGGMIVGTESDAAIIANPVAPSANNTQTQKVILSSIPITSSNPGTITGRNLYRTAVNGSQLLLLDSIADDTTTTFTDTTADASLGVNAPTANTAFIGTVLMQLGLSGQFVYIYAGDGTQARIAAGAGLTGTMIVNNGANGFTDPGLHIFGIVSETSSGYLSPPTVLTEFTTSATSSVSFANIPTGASDIIARYLVATQVITGFNGNLDGYEFFFVPGVVINNNTDTFINNVSFYDSELLSDASYLLNNYTQIPAGAVLNIYHNRLCVSAISTDISLMLVSAPGQPEAIDQVAGLIVVPLDGNPITNAQEMRDVLYIFKRAKTVAYADNGGDPSSWPLTVIDNAIGTSVHGIATVLDSGSSSVDFLLVCTYQGITQFNGKYVIPELSFNIEAYWKALNRNSFYLIQIVNAPVQKEIYIVLPAGNVLCGNYANGLGYKTMRWSPWSYTMIVNTVAIQNISDIIIGMDLVVG
jgi:hypothetical protein